MQIYLSHPVVVLDASQPMPLLETDQDRCTPNLVTPDPRARALGAGLHTVERIGSPYRPFGSTVDWIVLEGTRIGLPYDRWRQPEQANVDAPAGSTCLRFDKPHILNDAAIPRPPAGVLRGGEEADPRRTLLPPGVYAFEEVPNPYGHDSPWLVLAGTKIGAASEPLRDLADEVITSS
jgi:hypothetical protein